MDSNDTLRAIRRVMEEQSINLLLAFHDGTHLIEKANPVMVLSGFKSLGHALVILPRGDEGTLVVTPAWDAERAAERCPAMRCIGADNVVSALKPILGTIKFHHRESPRPDWQACRGVSANR